MNNFFAELKRRNVYKVAVAYVVAAWLLIQVATQVFPFFEIPNWAVRLVVLVLGLGFPIALILSWAFEITPEGIKREEDVAPNESVTRRTGRKLIGITIALALMAAGLLAYRIWSPKAGAKAVADTRPAPTPAASTAAAAAIPEKSIAVLPFDNLSEDKSNAYFAEGVQDEILTRLAKVADLKVISRTSTQHFKSSPQNLPEIARQLGVMNILEGSVQKSNDQVRVNVQLIHAPSDAHLWADTFDRKLIDIFAVESEIAQTIAETLQAKLTGSEKVLLAKKPTSNPEAYELYLKGRFFWNKRTAPDLRRSIEYFQQAIEKDPNYALAYAALAQAWFILPSYNGGVPKDCFPQAEAAAKKALALDDNLSDAHAALAAVRQLYNFDTAGAIAEFERAIQLNPNDANAHHWLGIQSFAFSGQFDRELPETKRAQELDPLSLVINTNLSWAYIYTGRFDEAVAQLRTTVEMDGGFYVARYTLGQALEIKGSIPEAIAEYQKAIALSDDPYPVALLGHLYGTLGRRDEALKILAQLREARQQHYIAAYCLAIVYLGLGDHNEAINWLEEAYRDRDGNGIGGIRVDPLLKALHGDPRFEALAEKIVPAREFRATSK